MPRARPGPEQQARADIDTQLEAAGWVVQDRENAVITAAQGVAVREFKLADSHGFADYLLFVDGKAVGVLEAKPAGHPLTSVEVQAAKYSTGLPPNLDPPVSPLPFLYVSTGVETLFINLLDPDPKSRRPSMTVPHVHRPATLAEWIRAEPQLAWPAEAAEAGGAQARSRPSTLRSRLLGLPPLERGSLYPNQVEAVEKLEASLRQNRPRALVQMATGSGKTIFAITSIYRLIKHAQARRVLFLVDRTNLGEQAEKEFQGYRTPDDNRLFTELYNVQRLTSNTIMDSSRVVITTIQRLYSMLKDEPELDPGAEEESQFESAGAARTDPWPVAYNPAYPPEFFDVIVVDECHRSIYTLWRQVLEYFDAFLVGLTATPAKQTFGFFHKNLVMEYPHERAVADGVNVDFEVYDIRTQITQSGSTIVAGPGAQVGYRDRQTRSLRWDQPDEDVVYDAADLDRRVVARDQIRTIIRTFKERLPIDIFPGRTEVPKTLIFAKDDSHAEDIVDTVREEFGRGNAFCQKITYSVTAAKPRDLIQAFRNQYEPRIAVTVDMIATGTDIKPIEIVMFMRAVKSRVQFEQMKGRGVRTIHPDDLQAVSGADAKVKTHFVIVDCVGLAESQLADTQPLERKRTLPLKALLEHVTWGGADPAVLSSLASRLSRLDKRCTPEQRKRLLEASGGVGVTEIARAIVEGLDLDQQLQEARKAFALPADAAPTAEQLARAAESLLKGAAKPLATKPAFRKALEDVKREVEQIIDDMSPDKIVVAGPSHSAHDQARDTVRRFEAYLEEHKDEIDALQFYFSVPYAKRPHYEDIKALADAIKAPPHSWTPERLWHAYEVVARDRVRGASTKRLIADLVSLIRFALHKDDELVPHDEVVRTRFAAWMAQQQGKGKEFTAEQVRWLELIRDHVATNLGIRLDDFDYVPFAEEGGRGRAMKVFGGELVALLDELNEMLAA